MSLVVDRRVELEVSDHDAVLVDHADVEVGHEDQHPLASVLSPLEPEASLIDGPPGLVPLTTYAPIPNISSRDCGRFASRSSAPLTVPAMAPSCADDSLSVGRARPRHGGAWTDSAGAGDLTNLIKIVTISLEHLVRVRDTGLGTLR